MKRFYCTLVIVIFGGPLTSQADEAVKALLPVFGKPLKAAKLPKAALPKAQVELGRVLYHEKRLSRDNSIACNSCHDTVGYGVDGKKFSLGFEGFGKLEEADVVDLDEAELETYKGDSL